MFVLEYVLDWDHRRAALAAGYPHSDWGARVMKKYAVQEAIREEKQARKDRLRVDGDRITEEFAKIAYANARDYVPHKGEVFDIHRLNVDQTAAIRNVDMNELVDPNSGEIKRNLHLTMHDKLGALNSLAKSVGMLTERHVIEGTIEHLVSQMTPDERVEEVQKLREKAQKVYLPRYMAEKADQVIDVTPEPVETPDG